MEATMIAMLAAMVIYHVMHAIMELKSVHYKLNKLEAKVDKADFKEKSFKVDNFGKMIGMMMVMMGMFLVLPFYLLKTAGVTIPMLIKMSVMLIVMVEIVTTMGYNNFHKKIGRVIGKIE